MSDTKRLPEFPEDIKDSAHKIWLAGLGAMAVTQEEGSKLFRNLVDRGASFEGVGRERIDDVKSKVEARTERAKESAEATWQKVEGRVENAVATALGRAGLPTRDEISTLSQRVEELTKLVEKMKG